jgi:hypothetical protein
MNTHPPYPLLDEREHEACRTVQKYLRQVVVIYIREWLPKVTTGEVESGVAMMNSARGYT